MYTVYSVSFENRIVYIGCTSQTLKRRFSSMASEKTALAKFVTKHGKDAFTIEPIQSDIPTKKIGHEIEASAVALCQPECNKTINGQGGVMGEDNNMKRPEHRARNSAVHKGRRVSDETREKLSTANKGKKLSTAHRAKISENNARLSGENHPMFGKKHSAEARAKISANNSGENHPMFGKKHSNKTRAKISAAQSNENHPMFGKPAPNRHPVWKYRNRVVQMRSYGFYQREIASFFGCNINVIQGILKRA